MTPVVAFLGLVLLAAPLAAQEGIPVVPIPEIVSPDRVELAGVWNYASYDHAASGPCPAGPEMAGELTIGGTQEALTLIVLSGAVCDPEAVCVYDGRREGDALMFSSTALLDEGASATSAMRIVFLSPTSAQASVVSRYVHPEGTECEWTHSLSLTRPGD